MLVEMFLHHGKPVVKRFGQLVRHSPMGEQTITPLMTLSEAAKFLRLRVSTLRAWRLQKRNLPFVCLGGGKVFVLRADVEALIAAGVEQPVDGAAASATNATP